MKYKVIRTMEYDYVDEETMRNDMARWTMVGPPYAKDMTVKTTNVERFIYIEKEDISNES